MGDPNKAPTTQPSLIFQVEKKEDGIAGEREENPVMEAVRNKIFNVGYGRKEEQPQMGEKDILK